MDGYTRVFDIAESKFNEASEHSLLLFQTFRSQSDIFGFIDNGDRPMDVEADSIAKRVNIQLYNEYRELLKSRKMLGYMASSKVHAHYSNLDSRHIMMFVLLFSGVEEPLNNIVEIGGGFGNWLTLNQHRSFNKWTIIDLPHLGLLQRWFLDQQGVDRNKYDILSALDYYGWAEHQPALDLVIGTHSLSEFSYDVFVEYFNRVVCKAKYFFYCYHNTRPTPQLIQAKLRLIESKFNLVHTTLSENKQVSNSLYTKRPSA